MSAREPDNTFSRLLAQGDPASFEPGLAPEVARGMKAAMLASIPQAPERRLSWVPLLAAGAATTLVLGLGLGAWFFSEAPLEPAPTAVAVTQPTLTLVPALPETSAPAGALTRHGASARSAKAVSRAKPTASRRPTPPPEVPSTRQLEFQTPGGTRVVWVLDPHFTLKATEASSR